MRPNDSDNRYLAGPPGTGLRPARKSIAAAIAATIALGPGSKAIGAQATADFENRYPSVGVIMVWRIDEAGNPVELRGFASGT